VASVSRFPAAWQVVHVITVAGACSSITSQWARFTETPPRICGSGTVWHCEHGYFRMAAVRAATKKAGRSG
jgi:hypothetical protein